MSSFQHILIIISICLQLQPYVNAAGYHYERPLTDPINIVTGASISVSGFDDLPTVQPIPLVPSLPPLPTARSKTQQLVQLHPPSSAINSGVQKSIASLYRPLTANYLPPSQSAPVSPSQPALSHLTQSYQIAQQQIQQAQQRAQLQLQPAPRQQIFGQRLSSPQRPQSTINFAPQIGVSAPAAPPTAPSSPSLLDPINLDQQVYTSNGRQLKQYAVVEIIDNDIEPTTQPFLTPFFDSFRAHFGASGTGATAFAGQQIESRADTSILDQQRQLITQTPTGGNDAIALGSGGLGFIRLNGNVYLGSGSLGYVSGQQRSEFLRNARTRSGASVPDALHFGHGPLGGAGNFLRK